MVQLKRAMVGSLTNSGEASVCVSLKILQIKKKKKNQLEKIQRSQTSRPKRVILNEGHFHPLCLLFALMSYQTD